MTAELIEKSRMVIDDATFREVVPWHLPAPVPDCEHPFKYRLALVMKGECVLRYDNERGKGRSPSRWGVEKPFTSTSLEALHDAL